MSDLLPRIYVACLAAYNQGYLHGIWLDADQDVDVLQAAVQDMLQASPIENAEEHEIHDYEDFSGLTVDQHTDLATASAWAKFIVKYGAIGAELIDYYSHDVEQASYAMENCYHGAYDNEADFVADFVEQTGMQLPESLCFYIDYERMARDWFISDFFSLDVDCKVHVFSCH